jgi:hypothetical protein
MGGMDLIEILFYLCVTLTNVLHYAEVAHDENKAYQRFLLPFEKALRAAGPAFHLVADLLHGTYTGIKEAVSRWKDLRFIGSQCNLLLSRYPEVVDAIPYPHARFPKMQLWWRAAYVFGLYLRRLLREVARIHLPQDDPKVCTIDKYYDNLCLLVCQVRFICNYWLPPRFSETPQARYGFQLKVFRLFFGSLQCVDLMA